jgi:hypothetical protein
MTSKAHLDELRHSATYLAQRLRDDGRTPEATLQALVEDFEASARLNESPIAPADLAAGYAVIARAVREAFSLTRI